MLVVGLRSWAYATGRSSPVAQRKNTDPLAFTVWDRCSCVGERVSLYTSVR